MAMTTRGFQTREPLEDTPYVILRSWPQVNRGLVVLRDSETGKDELWTKQDDFAGYVIVINGKGYEFVRSL